jgi:hypothetical protein
MRITIKPASQCDRIAWAVKKTGLRQLDAELGDTQEGGDRANPVQQPAHGRSCQG